MCSCVMSYYGGGVSINMWFACCRATADPQHVSHMFYNVPAHMFSLMFFPSVTQTLLPDWFFKLRTFDYTQRTILTVPQHTRVTHTFLMFCVSVVEITTGASVSVFEQCDVWLPLYCEHILSLWGHLRDTKADSAKTINTPGAKRTPRNTQTHKHTNRPPLTSITHMTTTHTLQAAAQWVQFLIITSVCLNRTRVLVLPASSLSRPTLHLGPACCSALTSV